MTKTSTSDQQTAWTRYWNTGVLHSCPDAFHQNYAGEILSFWHDLLQNTSNGARILDIATGNGAVAFLADQLARDTGRQFIIDAIDAAAIRPLDAAARHGLPTHNIAFHSHTPAEDTPYEDGLFDIACSQYGIEYSKLQLSLPELARILKPGGQAGLLMHHPDSAAAVTTRAELAAMAFLRDQAPILQTARWLLDWSLALGPGADPMQMLTNPQARAQVDQFNSLRTRINQHASQAAHAGFIADIAMQCARILQMIPSLGLNAAMRDLDLLEAEVQAHAARLAAMSEACLDERKLNDALTLASSSGLSERSRRLLYRNNTDLLGWAVTLIRDGD